MIKSSTVLLFVKHGNEIVVGADKRASWGMSKAHNLDTKLFKRKDGSVLTGTGLCSTIQVYGEAFKLPKHPRGKPDKEFLMTDVKNALWKFLAANEQLEVPSSSEDEEHTFLLLVYNGLLAEFGITQKHVNVDLLNFPYAHGCGGMYTMGAYEALKDNVEDGTLSIQDAASKALRIAGIYSPGCSLENEIITVNVAGNKNDKNTVKRTGRRGVGKG